MLALRPEGGGTITYGSHNKRHFKALASERPAGTILPALSHPEDPGAWAGGRWWQRWPRQGYRPAGYGRGGGAGTFSCWAEALHSLHANSIFGDTYLQDGMSTIWSTGKPLLVTRSPSFQKEEAKPAEYHATGTAGRRPWMLPRVRHGHRLPPSTLASETHTPIRAAST